MKKKNKRLLTLILCGLLLAMPLASCSDTDKQVSSSNSGTTENTPSASKPSVSTPSGSTSEDSGGNDIQKDSYEEQIAYYMELTESLQAELLKLKEDSYIEECQYQLQIETLEETVKQLKDTLAVMSNSSAQLPSNNNQTPQDDQIALKNEYKYTEQDGKLTITEYVGSDLEVSVPKSINGMKVAVIGEEAFKGKQIRSVTLPSGIEKIDWFAFSGCTVLESISIPSSVMSVGYGAFEYCPKSMKIKCEKGSYIEAYALSWGIAVSAE